MSIEIRRILVPVDFSDASARAVEAGGLIARSIRAELHLLHAEALEAPVYFTHEQVEVLAAQRRALQHQAEAYLVKFGRRHTPSPFTAAVVASAPTVAILEHAASADLVVMGTHGRRGPSLWWLGSVTERLLREIDRPLLVVHAGDQPSVLFTRVCVCAEPPATGERALGLAATLAAPFSGSVTDRRHDLAPPAAADDATLLVVATPHDGDRVARSRIGVARIRNPPGSVLFVPE